MGVGALARLLPLVTGRNIAMDRTETKPTDTLDTLLNVLFKLGFFLGCVATLAFLWVPFILVPLINRKLARMPDFGGNIRRLYLNVFDASLSLHDLRIAKKEEFVPVGYLTLDRIHVAIRVYKRKMLIDVSIRSFGINLVKGLDEEHSQMYLNKAWYDFINSLMLLNINRLEVENGMAHFRTYHTEPNIDVFMDNIKMTIKDLDVRARARDPLPSDISMTAHIHGGEFKLNGTLAPLSAYPTFDLNAELHGLQLVEINSVLLYFAGMDVSRGELSFSTELASKDRKLTGYVKPVVKDLKMFNWRTDRRNSFKKILKELFVDGMVGLFKNHRKDQVATKIVIDGELTAPGISLWSAIGCVLCNAFVQSILPQVENSVSIDSVGHSDKTSCFGEKEGV